MQRVDLLLVELGFAKSRTHAQRLIKNGKVQANLKGQWQAITKPGLKVEANIELKVAEDPADRFVSRGALKLLGALEHCKADLTGKVAIDVGQSTGGFSDCLIQNGISKVVGIEVGYDQLADKLRDDPRVVCYEGMNARELPAEKLLAHTDGSGFDLAVMDVSFISQTKILPSLIPLMKPEGLLISLVKPQFEVGKSGIGSGGIVRDESLYPKVKENIINCCELLGVNVTDYLESPITGGDGNREFLLIGQKR
ncbi:TlyA family RNA methyltransferase [Neptuniibacter sp.]|uniref:TlyA family RNA methyltransferase n=1 Tax=Neptuniibacter sp. TaxID=1962643 RepID=UPI00262FA0A5|nr:TlyA family RNA methyltransferase [Neptuniibacter sp.]MCP4595466.1 TlyA family RNA methyltransferase [Neptuniibacter sp.]